MNTAIIYLRVSTSDQTEESQLSECMLYCKEHNYKVFQVFRDHARSAYKNVKRPEYEKVLQLVKQKSIGHIVVWSLDRWTRKGHTELKNNIIYLNNYNVKLHSVKEHWIENINIEGSMGDLIRDFFFGLVGWLAEQESSHKSDRIHASEKFQKAKKEHRIGRPSIPIEVIDRVLQALDDNKSYSRISREITYKQKYGKVKHISSATISKISKMR